MNQPFLRCLNWVFLLLVSMIMASGCTQMPSAEPIQGDVTALQIAVERHRQENLVTVPVEEYIPIQENDMIAVDTTGRALLRFSDRLLVELFRGTQMEIAEVTLEPSDLVFVRLKQVVGHSSVELESIANARVVLGTDYATITPRTSDTKFAVCQAPGVTCTVTIKGETEVQAQGQVVTVRGGEGTFIMENEPPLPPICVDLEAIRRWQDQLRSLQDVPPLVEFVIASQGNPCPRALTQPLTAEEIALSSTATATLGIPSIEGEEDLWVNPIDKAVYGRVPAGEFIMGTAEGNNSEQPVHSVYLDEFWIMQTEVTNAQYTQCVDAGACTPPSNERWSVPAFADHPVTGVDWSQTNVYAAWVGGRLPTEAEWEKAARGTNGRVYPWGDEKPDKQRANFNFIIGFTMPVGSYLAGASPYGMLDMAGNAEEWVADWYAQDYYASSPERNPQGPETGALRVLRGGSFRQNLNDIRASVRVNVSPESKFDSAGFRIARSAPSD